MVKVTLKQITSLMVFSVLSEYYSSSGYISLAIIMQSISLPNLILWATLH